jgi:hypothetical protein
MEIMTNDEVEAENLSYEELKDGADFFDKLVKEKRKKQ